MAEDVKKVLRDAYLADGWDIIEEKDGVMSFSTNASVSSSAVSTEFISRGFARKYAVELGGPGRIPNEVRHELLEGAITDSLTGLYTHRYFGERLFQEAKKARTRKEAFAVVMIDLDRLKEFNEVCGHPSGDKLLGMASEAMVACARKTDVVCRYGGDEFAVLLPATDKQGACQLAEQMRKALELELAKVGTIAITGSFGVASFPDDADNGPDLLAKADIALYAAKKKTNKVVAASPMME